MRQPTWPPHRTMKRCSLLLIICLLFTACASAPPTAPQQARLLDDTLFAPPAEPVRPEQIFALTDAMKAYADTELASQMRTRGMKQGMLDALYRKNQLRLEYDPERTRNAAEAFEARAGNCLSLVIMTAAFAKHMGLQVSYQSVYTDEIWTRNQDTYFASGHVNITLGQRLAAGTTHGTQTLWTIDFLPPEDLRGLRSREVNEAIVTAMYMNNRAVEALAAGDLNTAYAWARAAMLHEPRFLSAYNTLGVIYLRHGQPQMAERALGYVLEKEPSSTVAMNNMTRTLSALGRPDEAAALARRLAQLDPEPPFHFFDLGQTALRAGDNRAARDWFAKELARVPYNPEFNFWLAVADFHLGEFEQARKHLTIALQNSTRRSERQLYAAKLDHLRQLRLQ